jgi:hypothetical protein
MSRHGDISLPFGTEERVFRLGIGELRKIEERCNAGAPELMTRLAPLVRAVQGKLTFSQILAAGMLGSWRIDDVREPILQGLIGGGMGATEAGLLVRSELDSKLSIHFAPIAFLILEAAFHGPEEDLPDMGERKAPGPKPRRRSRTAAPASPT